MKKKMFILAVSAIVLLAAGLVIRTESDSFQFINRNVEALSQTGELPPATITCGRLDGPCYKTRIFPLMFVVKCKWMGTPDYYCDSTW